MLSENLKSIQDKMELAATLARRSILDIRLLPVSKSQSASIIRDAYKLGLREFGENYCDEMIKKASELADLRDLKWVYIGKLQSNKIRKIVEVASEVQSMASVKHADYLQRYVSESRKRHFPVWINVNAGDESSKGGVPLDEVLSLSRYVTGHCPDLLLMGIMAIPPAQLSDDNYRGMEVPSLYLRLRELADQVGQGKLSLGMSSDLKIAITAGSDCVRLGTALFGARV